MKVAVIGAGSWGTALAQVAAANRHDVMLWAHRTSVADGINTHHRNPDYLKDAQLDVRVKATADVARALEGAQAVIVVTPSKHMRETAQRLVDASMDASVPAVICTKGVEGGTGLLPVQIYAEVLGGEERFAVLSGPNHAEEIVHGVAAGTVVASSNPETAAFFQALLGSGSFRVYTSDDVAGVELCAAFKNVIAIAVGVSYGLGFGDNTAAMLMTRGQAEMGRLVAAVGGDSMTCMGLAGTGDLIATCMSRHSRNRMFGEALARGVTVEQYEAERHMVAEGAQACRTLQTLAERFDVELPVTDVVRGMVWEGVDPRAASELLLSREMKPEFY